MRNGKGERAGIAVPARASDGRGLSTSRPGASARAGENLQLRAGGDAVAVQAVPALDLGDGRVEELRDREQRVAALDAIGDLRDLLRGPAFRRRQPTRTTSATRRRSARRARCARRAASPARAG